MSVNNKMLYRILNESTNNTIAVHYWERNLEIITRPFFYLNELPERNYEIPDENAKEKTLQISHSDKRFNSVFSPDYKKIANSYFNYECKLIGFIKEVDRKNKTFIAIMRNSIDNIDREITFSFNEMIEKEQSQITEGKRIIFIYGKEFRNGTQNNVSTLYFRQELTWSANDINKRMQEADQWFRYLNAEVYDE